MTGRPWRVEFIERGARTFATRERAFECAATATTDGLLAAWVLNTRDPLAARFAFVEGRPAQVEYRTSDGWSERPTLGDIQWWSALTGTAWTLIDVEAVGERKAAARVREVIDAGGTVRPATSAERAAWADLQLRAAALREASSVEERWAALGVDPGHEQIALL